MDLLARHCMHEGGPARAQADVARVTVERGSQLVVAKTVVLELAGALRGVYGDPRSVCRAFEHLLSMPHVEIEVRSAVEAAPTSRHEGLDVADALDPASSPRPAPLPEPTGHVSRSA